MAGLRTQPDRGHDARARTLCVRPLVTCDGVRRAIVRWPTTRADDGEACVGYGEASVGFMDGFCDCVLHAVD